MPVSDTRHVSALRAALYLRMSTDMQKYSTENQALVLLAYAERNNLEVVRTYEDSGKSGVAINGRDALQRLIADVESGRNDFEVILVYDVTRWGRFQDPDESAYYEQVCKRAGVQVRFCVEQFENDGSMSSTLIKSLKRFMSGAYSQDLSKKVFLGASRLVELGFRQGGTPGLGLRRLLVDQDRNTKSELSRGERKSLQTDRIILVPGPDDEVATGRHRAGHQAAKSVDKAGLILGPKTPGERLACELGGIGSGPVRARPRIDRTFLSRVRGARRQRDVRPRACTGIDQFLLLKAAKGFCIALQAPRLDDGLATPV